MKITSQSENEASNFFVILQSRYSLPKEISGMFMFSLIKIRITSRILSIQNHTSRINKLITFNYF